MAFKTFTDGSILTAADVNTYLARQAVIVCTSGTRPSSPTEGMTIYETDTNAYRGYDGTAWQLIATLGYPTTWTGLTLVSGYGNFTGFAAAVRMLTPSTVELRGGIKKTSGAIPTATHVATLPSSTYYPPVLATFVCPAERIASAGWSVRIEINTSGQIHVFHANPGGTTYDPTWFEMNGCVRFDKT